MKNDLTPVRFLVIFASGALITLLVIGAFNIAFDPYGEFDSGLFWSNVDRAGAIDGRGRSAKLILLYRQEAPPQVLLMGNSRAVALPTDVTEAQTGLRAFNAATVNGSLYDLLAFTRYLLDQPDQDLRAVILSVDSFLFSASADIELERFPLASYVPELPKSLPVLQAKRVLRTVSFDTTTASIRAFYRNAVQQSPVIYTYGTQTIWEPDGTLYHLVYDPMAQADQFSAPLADRLAQVQPIWAEDYQAEDLLPDEKRILFETWLKLAQENDICVTLFYPPLHSALLEYLIEHSDYERHRAELLEYLQALQGTYDFRFFNLETVEPFGGDDRWFIEGVHPLRPNTERIIQFLTTDDLCGNSSRAVQ